MKREDKRRPAAEDATVARRSEEAPTDSRSGRPVRVAFGIGDGKALADLIACVLGIDPSRPRGQRLLVDILDRWPTARAMRAASPDDLQELEAMTEARLARWMATFALAEHSFRAPLPTRPRLNSSRAVFDLLHYELRDLDVEVFEVLSLDAKNRLRRRDRISRGTLTGSLVHPREVFKAAIASRAAAIVVAHNHPSGDPEPSAEDLRITDRLAAAGEILGIRLLDHIVVGDGRYVSLADAGAVSGASGKKGSSDV